MQNINERTNTK